MKKTVVLLALIAPLPTLAQRDTVRSNGRVSAVATTGKLWEQVTNYIAQSADDMPEATYAYRPTPEVRTFGQLIGHLAGAQNSFCASALGEKVPNEDEIEKTHTTKASLAQAFRESNTYCARAYAQSDAVAGAPADFFGQPQTRLYILLENLAHDNEHYGNIVTYLRLNGIVPPSSRPQR